MGGMWFLSPSGWPTWADDQSDHEWDLQERGYELIDASQVAAAVAAYQAGTTGPAPQDPLTEAEAAAAVGGSGPLAVALRVAFGLDAGQAPTDAATAAFVGTNGTITRAALDDRYVTAAVDSSGGVTLYLDGAEL